MNTYLNQAGYLMFAWLVLYLILCKSFEWAALRRMKRDDIDEDKIAYASMWFATFICVAIYLILPK